MAKGNAHHGGAWKVAYADFVTAMMALFMVLWISAQDQRIVLATSRYFQNPFRSATPGTSGVMPFNESKSSRSAGEDPGSQAQEERNKHINLTFLNSVAADFHRLLNIDDTLEGKAVQVEVTSDGLRVTLFDRAKRPLFAGNTTEFTEWGRFVLQNLAWIVDRHRFRVTLEGHTKSGLVMPREDYSSWELSADRANAARRSLVHYAVYPELIERVSGYGSTKSVPGEPADSDVNQRIVMSLTLTARARFEEGKVVEVPRLPDATAASALSP